MGTPGSGEALLEQAIPYAHHREWILGMVQRAHLDPVEERGLLLTIAGHYPDWPAARGFGPLGYEDVQALVRAYLPHQG